MTNITYHTKPRKTRGHNEPWGQPAGVGLFGPTRMAGVCIILFFFAVIYIVLGHQCRMLSRDIGALEVEQRRLNEELNRERSRWSDTKSPANLERALGTHRLVMQNPTERQLIYITPVYRNGQYSVASQ